MQIIKPTNNKRELGASLIEAVVSLFVFSVGILGVAAIQASSLVRTDDVKQRSLAIWKAQELADRIKATRTVTLPGGEIARYRGIVGNNVAAIDSFDIVGTYQCANNAPARCDDTEGGMATSCGVQELVEFDVWSVICDPANGVSDTQISDLDGVNKLKSLDIAMATGPSGENFLYFSWLSRAADRNESLQPDDGDAAATVATLLCGQERQVDSRLETYCLRFF